MLVGLLSTGRGEADRAITSLADRFAAAGFRLAGLVQTNVDRPGRSRCDMILCELAGGRKIGISQDLGPAAKGCRLDHGALQVAAGWVESSITSDIDLLLINKFGKREAAGAGLRSAITLAVDLGIPVIAGLAPENREAWDVFCGDMGEVVQLDEADSIILELLSLRNPGRIVETGLIDADPEHSIAGVPAADTATCRGASGEVRHRRS